MAETAFHTMAGVDAGPLDPFSGLRPCAPDPLLSLIRAHTSDPRVDKVDLGVGVYRNEEGTTPVMRAVKDAEWRLATYQQSKAYLGTEGDTLYLDLLAQLVFGQAPPAITSVQTVGGTGALRLAGELVARSRPDACVWMTAPSWPIHKDIFEACGLEMRTVAHVDADGRADVDRFRDALEHASPGDVVLLQACCHNPTGVDYTVAEWNELGIVIQQRGLLPLIDCAYHGLGEDLQKDVAGLRLICDMLPNSLVAYSCNKNFALYRERTGALFVKSSRQDVVAANLLNAARRLWSMPPGHGAAIVREILADATLREEWEAELASMTRRIRTLRRELALRSPFLRRLDAQKGLFSILPVPPQAIERLRSEEAVYMAGSGRITVTGLNRGNMDTFVAALARTLEEAA